MRNTKDLIRIISIFWSNDELGVCIYNLFPKYFWKHVGYRIREMFPSYGPYHGGTEVTITLDDTTPSRIDQVFVEFHLTDVTVNRTFNATVSTWVLSLRVMIQKLISFQKQETILESVDTLISFIHFYKHNLCWTTFSGHWSVTKMTSVKQ